ncbi:cubilin [Caerostris extrusa]|uniref:Cubilin n=1 Tax=Caerostris extrusa TaxID=172846 RepID=A0AAV4S6U4_CAEEX|nr:cubilin [Caerostris extrusa]
MDSRDEWINYKRLDASRRDLVAVLPSDNNNDDILNFSINTLHFTMLSTGLQSCWLLFIGNCRIRIKSPGYPTDAYADDLNCRYRVMKSSPSVCDLIITVLDFKLQEGEVCENDYLQIAEERLCGTIESGMTRMYPFGDSDNILMNFDTDGSMGDKGFHISGMQKECNATLPPSTNTTDKQRKAQNAWDCDRTISGAEDSIRSPGFPDAYPANVDCRWMVLRADPRYCELEITINNLHIQVGESCQFDYLEVDGHRFCGSTTAGNKRIFSFKTEQIVIHFHSDDTVDDRGFEVTLKQRDCPTTTTTAPATSSCDQVFDSKKFILVSPNHPRDYDNGLNCRYVIRRSSEDVCRLEMQFLRFDVESSSDCEYDYLAINGEKICGLIENTTRTYLFQDYEKQLTFHSDSGTSRPGFMIRVQQVDCSVATTEPRCPLPSHATSASPRPPSNSAATTTPTTTTPTCDAPTPSPRPTRGVRPRTHLPYLRCGGERGCQYDYLKVQEERLCGIYPSNLKRIIPFEEIESRFGISFGRGYIPGRVSTLEVNKWTAHLSLTQYRLHHLKEVVTWHLRTTVALFRVRVFRTLIQHPGNVCIDSWLCRNTAGSHSSSWSSVSKLITPSAKRISCASTESSTADLNCWDRKRTVTFYGFPREVNVTFESDAELADKGFYAVYRQLPCSPALGRSPSQRTDAKPRSVIVCMPLWLSASSVRHIRTTIRQM